MEPALTTHAHRDAKRLQLHRNAVVGIFIYYAFILIAGVAISLFLSRSLQERNLTIDAPILSLAMALVGASLTYSRKLYKACIEEDYSFNETAVWDVRTIGTLAFFAFRPLFGVGFAIFVYFLWKAALLASVDKADLTQSHFYIAGALGFFSGFLTGRLIERFEDKGLGELDKLTGLT